MKKVIGLILIIVGGYLCYAGYNQQHSVSGAIDSAASTVANKVDGDPHPTNAVWYYVGGGVLILIGAVSVLGGGRKV